MYEKLGDDDYCRQLSIFKEIIIPTSPTFSFQWKKNDSRWKTVTTSIIKGLTAGDL